MTNTPEQVISPAWIDAGSDGEPKYDAETMRALFSVLYEPGPTTFSAKPGIITGLDVNIDGHNMVISPGLVIVNNPRGSFITGLKRPTSLPLIAKHQSLGRKDLLVFQINDIGPGRGGELKMIAGEPAVNPSAPSVPGNCLALGEVLVPAVGAISYKQVADRVALRGANKPNKNLGLGPGAENGFIRINGSMQEGRMSVSATGSGSAQKWASVGAGAAGSGLLRKDGTYEYWLGSIRGGNLYVTPTPPKGTKLYGTIEYFGGTA